MNKDNLCDELKIYYNIIKESLTCIDVNLNSVVNLLNIIYRKGFKNILPQVCVCLRLLAVLPVSVAIGERL